MTTAWGGVRSEERAAGDSLQYLLASGFGVLAGWIDIKFSDLLFTALIVLLSCMLLGFVRPKNAWRWVVLVESLCRSRIGSPLRSFRRSRNEPRSTRRF